MKFFSDLFSNIIFAIIVLAIAGCIERIIWISFDSNSYGKITPEFAKQKLAVNTETMCSISEVEYVEYKVKKDNSIELRCSFFPGVSLPFWPFYSATTIKADYRHIDSLKLTRIK